MILVYKLNFIELCLTVTIDGLGAPVKCSITSQFDFLIGVWGVRGVFGECGCELGVCALEVTVSWSSSKSTLGFLLSIPPPPVTCCLKLAHLLVLRTELFSDRVPNSPCKYV